MESAKKFSIKESKDNIIQDFFIANKAVTYYTVNYSVACVWKIVKKITLSMIKATSINSVTKIL